MNQYTYDSRKRRKRIQALSENGQTFAAIAKEYGVSFQRIREIVRMEQYRDEIRLKETIEITVQRINFVCNHPQGLRFLTYYDNFHESGAA